MTERAIQHFRANFPIAEAIEVAVIENGEPGNERGFVLRESGQIIDAETFLLLYEPAQPASDSGKRAPAKKKAASRGAKRTSKAAPPASSARDGHVSTWDLCRQALLEKPVTTDQCTVYVQKHGKPEVGHQTVYAVLWAKRKVGVVKDDDNGVWSLVA